MFLMARLDYPLYDFGGSAAVGLWNISETEEEFYGICSELLSVKGRVDAMKSKARRLEFLAVRALLKDMLGYVPEIHHDGNGRPYMDGGVKLSVSHTRGYAAVIISRDCGVAVDIEYVSDRVCRVAEKFLRKDESVATPLEKLAVWCAKESLYKLHSGDKLSFHEIRVPGTPGVEKAATGRFCVENLRRGYAVDMYFAVNGDFLLTYTAENAALEKSR